MSDGAPKVRLLLAILALVTLALKSWVESRQQKEQRT